LLPNAVIKSWHSKINYAKDLIASKITRSKNIGLNSINALPLDKGESSVGGKQKQPQNDNDKLLLDNNYEKGIMDFHNNPPKASKNPSFHRRMLLQPLITPLLSLQCHTGIQMRQESFLQQEMVKLHCNQLTIRLRY
jgi:hypothetical protein